MCLLGFNTASGDVMCEEDDEDKGLCLYEGWFFIVETIPTTVEDISCEWVVREGERRFECEPINYKNNCSPPFFSRIRLWYMPRLNWIAWKGSR